VIISHSFNATTTKDGGATKENLKNLWLLIDNYLLCVYASHDENGGLGHIGGCEASLTSYKAKLWKSIHVMLLCDDQWLQVVGVTLFMYQL
jgi:hypothetical protein